MRPCRHLAIVAAALFATASPCGAQIATAEMQTIAQAMTAAELTTTWYFVPEALDDGSNPSANPAYQYINDQGGPFVIKPNEGRFRASRVAQTVSILGWDGPYATYQLGRIQTGTTPYDQGTPLDPWGSPYYFHSPLGLLRGDTGQTTLEVYGDQFNAYTLVSLGPDGVKSSDDLFYQFGAVVTVFSISSLRTLGGPPSSPLTAPAGTPIAIRGVNLGASQSGATVWLDSLPITDVLSWSNREVSVTLPSALETSGTLRIERAGNFTNGLGLEVYIPPACAEGWELYP